MNARFAAVPLSLLAAVAIVEAGLAINGRFNYLVASMAADADAIWALPTGTRLSVPHPDLKVTIEERLDDQGVRNHAPVPTARKSNIIGVFGDSFTENRYLDDQFTLTTLLDGTTEPQARVVNYGVSGYGVDQAYLRYKKFEDHDIRHVVYLFCANDLRNLSETRLAHVVGDDVVFRAPEATLASTTRRALGRLRFTYLVLWVYARYAGSTAASDLVRPDTRPRLVETRSPDADLDATQWEHVFKVVVQKWQREVIARGRTFTVLVLPFDQHTALARTLFQDFTGSVLYLQPRFGTPGPIQFANDGHWNEYGNLKAAEIVAGVGWLPFHDAIVRPEFLQGAKARIDDYYRAHR